MKTFASYPQLTILDWFQEIFSLFLVVFLISLPILNYADLSDQVPTHYNFYGEADAFGNKSAVWTLPIIGSILYMVFLLVNVSAGNRFNYPVRVTAKNRNILIKIAKRTIRFEKVVVLSLFNFLNYKTIMIAKGESFQRNYYSFFLIIAAFLIPIIIMIVKMNLVAREN